MYCWDLRFGQTHSEMRELILSKSFIILKYILNAKVQVNHVNNINHNIPVAMTSL